MANLHRLTVQEGINAAGQGGVWTVNTAAATGSNADVTNTIHLDVSGAAQLGIYAANSIHFKFSADAGSDCNTSNDLIIPATTLIFITVPQGLGSTVYFNHLSTGTDTGAVRVVEV